MNNLAIKWYKDKIIDIQFKYVMNINEIQMKLQPTTPQEVLGKRETDLKATMAGISIAVVDCGKLLDESLQIWTSLKEDPNVLKLQEDI